MEQLEIIKKFRNGELKPNQTFVEYLNPVIYRRAAYVSISVSEVGDSLICRLHDRNRRPFANRWIIHEMEGEFKEVGHEWDSHRYSHEDIFK